MLDVTARQLASRSADPRERAGRDRVDRMLFAGRDAGNMAARDALVERFLPLARSLARRYERSGEPMEDLAQVASLGLVKAVDRFDPANGAAFTSYAVPTIVGELKRYLRDRTWMVRPPRGLQELALRVPHAISDFTSKHNRSPTVGQLAEALAVNEEQILEALQARDGRGALSLQASSGADDEQQMLQDTIGVEDDGFALAESRTVLDALMSGLSPRMREIVRLRFHEDLTQAQIGERLGVSQMQISRLLRQALRTLREVADSGLLTAVGGRV